MDSSLKLFLIGLVIGLSVLLIEIFAEHGNLWNNSGNYFGKLLSVSATLWHYVFVGMTAISIPFIAIEPLKKRLTPKQYLPFPFMAGNSFGFLSLQLISMILQTIT